MTGAVESGATRDAIPARASEDEIRSVWRKRWGLPVVTFGRAHAPEDVEGLVLRAGDGDASGLVTWRFDVSHAELVSLDALAPGHGVGSRLLAAAEEHLRARGATQLRLATTSDNVDALRFYLRRGYRLVRVHLDAMDEVRARKPGVPAQGKDGVPLQDIWELRKLL